MEFDAIYDEEEDGGTPRTANEPEGDSNPSENPDDNSHENPEEPELDEYGNPEGTEYDEEGNPSNLDEEGNLINEEDETDEQGNPAGTEYDEEGNPTNLNEDGSLQATEGSPMARFFETKFGVKDGKIPFDDGTSMSLDEMTPEQQYEALEFYTDHLVKKAPGDVSKEEQAVLQTLRKSGKSFNDLVAEEVNNRIMKKEVESRLGKPIDYNEVPDEEIYRAFIKDSKPDASDEEVDEIVKAGKDHPAYEGTVKHYRTHLEKEQESNIAQQRAKLDKEASRELEEDRETLIETARNIDNIAGWPLNDDVKNELLEDLVEVDAEGASPFMREVLGDPAKMLQAAWYMKYGEAYYTELNNYWKKKFEAETGKGKNPSKGPKMTKPGKKVSPGKKVNKVGASKKVGDKKKFKTMEDIYD